MRNLFRRHAPGGPDASGKDAAPRDDMWVRCSKCREALYRREWESNFKVCTKCGFHDQLRARERVSLLLDEGSFAELDAQMRSVNALDFSPPGLQPYPDKLAAQEKASGLPEAAIYGTGTIDAIPVVLAVLDMAFFAGTMGSVVGEKITRACEVATQDCRPLIICSASGGARQQEGILALMQMAKTVAALNRLVEAKVPYISILADPTLAGVMASFAALGDCVIAEAGAVIGFAGPRIVEQTINEKLPPGTDTAEFQLKHGMVDVVVTRRELRDAIVRVLRLFTDSVRRARAAPHAEQNGVLHTFAAG